MTFPMKFRSRQHPAGIALIVVMIAIAIFSAMAAALAYSMKVETRLAMNADNEEQLYWLGRSGVELARYVLAQEGTLNRMDALNQIWAGGSGSAAETNSVLTGLSLDNYPVGQGTVSVKIVDLDRKVNINTANTEVLQRALTLMGADADDLSVVSDSIQDWIDADDSPRVAGAESDYYQGLTPPYYAKNAPIDNLSELLLVKGITPAMYWGGNATNHAPGTLQLPKLGFGNAPGQEPDYPFGLVDVFTPISSGRININTAGTNVLQMLPGVDGDMADKIVLQRAGPDGVEGDEDDTPFQNPNQLATVGINQQFIGRITQLCTTRSSVFEIQVTAHIGDASRDYTALIYRKSGTDLQVMGFFWK